VWSGIGRHRNAPTTILVVASPSHGVDSQQRNRGHESPVRCVNIGVGTYCGSGVVPLIHSLAEGLLVLGDDGSVPRPTTETVFERRGKLSGDAPLLRFRLA
jgi:hypothetical protein